jgi:hypothetical protein
VVPPRLRGATPRAEGLLRPVEARQEEVQLPVEGVAVEEMAVGEMPPVGARAVRQVGEPRAEEARGAW